jgi:NAD(P)-dependent dehydrogenase (short-subunit alcohol dehydrogenase family)
MPRPLLCSPELLQIDLSGKTFFVTGGNSGIGLATVSLLARQGARVLAGCRNVEASETVFAGIRSPEMRGSIEVVRLDLGDLASVRKCAERILAKVPRLDGLVNNAGVMNTPQGRTKDGFETQFGTNHLGHFLLTELLIPQLIESAPSRIVNLSSCYHDKAMGRNGKIDLDDPNFLRRRYDGWGAYAQSKLANLLHAKELSQRLADRGVAAFSVHPGWVRTRLIGPTMPLWFQDYVLRPFGRWVGMIEPFEGTQSTLFALLSPEALKHPGGYFSQIGWYRDRKLNGGGWPLRSPNPQANDPELPGKLDRLSRTLVGMS